MSPAGSAATTSSGPGRRDGVQGKLSKLEAQQHISNIAHRYLTGVSALVGCNTLRISQAAFRQFTTCIRRRRRNHSKVAGTTTIAISTAPPPPDEVELDGGAVDLAGS